MLRMASFAARLGRQAQLPRALSTSSLWFVVRRREAVHPAAASGPPLVTVVRALSTLSSTEQHQQNGDNSGTWGGRLRKRLWPLPTTGILYFLYKEFLEPHFQLMGLLKTYEEAEKNHPFLQGPHIPRPKLEEEVQTWLTTYPKMKPILVLSSERKAVGKSSLVFKASTNAFRGSAQPYFIYVPVSEKEISEVPEKILQNAVRVNSDKGKPINHITRLKELVKKARFKELVKIIKAGDHPIVLIVDIDKISDISPPPTDGQIKAWVAACKDVATNVGQMRVVLILNDASKKVLGEAGLLINAQVIEVPSRLTEAEADKYFDERGVLQAKNVKDLRALVYANTDGHLGTLKNICTNIKQIQQDSTKTQQQQEDKIRRLVSGPLYQVSNSSYNWSQQLNEVWLQALDSNNRINKSDWLYMTPDGNVYSDYSFNKNVGVLTGKYVCTRSQELYNDLKSGRVTKVALGGT